MSIFNSLVKKKLMKEMQTIKVSRLRAVHRF